MVHTKTIELKNIDSEINVYDKLISSQPIILYSEVGGILKKGNINFQFANFKANFYDYNWIN